jgi:hypothetical protein
MQRTHQNNVVDPYFQSAKGVRRGDPFSPSLCLTKMVLRAQENNLITGFASDILTKEWQFYNMLMIQFSVSSTM